MQLLTLVCEEGPLVATARMQSTSIALAISRHVVTSRTHGGIRQFRVLR